MICTDACLSIKSCADTAVGNSSMVEKFGASADRISEAAFSARYFTKSFPGESLFFPRNPAFFFT